MSIISDITKALLKEEITLKQHIDAPILKTIGLMNLWGLRTTWACAGMHYDNPVVKKDHAPMLQIFIHADAGSFEKLVRLIDCNEFAWGSGTLVFRLAKQMNQDPMIIITGPAPAPAPNGGMWNTKDSPHVHEYTNMIIRMLNDRLLTFKDEFKEQASLHDQNAVMKTIHPHWAYEPSKDWQFTKKDILEMA